VIWRESDPSMPARKQSETTRDSKDPNFRFYKPPHRTTGRPCEMPKRGWAWPHRWPDASRDSFESLAKAGRIAWGDDETTIPQYKRFLHEVETNVAKSFFHDFADGEKQVASLFGATGIFPNPKPTTLPGRFVSQTAGHSSLILDFFAGSGTTGHAVISLNREYDKRRKFLLVEMADYFDTILIPRVKKVMFTPEWKDGKPKRLVTKEEADRTPRLVKVLRLESYEDALHNTFSEKAIERLAGREKAYQDSVGDEKYRIRYLLALPVEKSDSMLNLAALEHPFDYTLEVLTDHGPRSETVDIVETFNWLYGLRVHRLLRRVNAKDRSGKKKTGRVYQAVIASDRERKKSVLVVWRDMTHLDAKLERPFLEEFAKDLGTFEERWINGDTAALGFVSLDGLFKRLIEQSPK
jgi:adenine-specific DNA-methyltransferase